MELRLLAPFASEPRGCATPTIAGDRASRARGATTVDRWDAAAVSSFTAPSPPTLPRGYSGATTADRGAQERQ